MTAQLVALVLAAQNDDWPTAVTALGGFAFMGFVIWLVCR